MLTLIILVALAVVGFISRGKGIIPDRLKSLLYRYVFFIATPTAIIYAVATIPSKDYASFGPFLGANIFAYLIVFFGITFILKKRRLYYKTRGVIEYSSNTPNTIFIGFPLIAAIFRPEVFIYAVLIGALVDAILNSTRIIVISAQQGGKKSTGITPRAVAKSLLNPLLIALIIGYLLSRSEIQLPYMLMESLRLIGKTSSYIAMIVLGASLYGLHILKSYRKHLVIITTTKLVILPAMVLVICTAFGLNKEARDISVMMSALPVAVFSLIVAANLKLDEKLASSAILVTTCLSPLSILAWYTILQLLLV